MLARDRSAAVFEVIAVSFLFKGPASGPYFAGCSICIPKAHQYKQEKACEGSMKVCTDVNRGQVVILLFLDLFLYTT